MGKVLFDTTSLQKSRRILLPAPLLQNLNLKQGDPLDVFLDTDAQEIVVKKAKDRSKKQAGRTKR